MSIPVSNVLFFILSPFKEYNFESKPSLSAMQSQMLDNRKQCFVTDQVCVCFCVCVHMCVCMCMYVGGGGGGEEREVLVVLKY